MQRFDEPAVVIVKHANPCGVAVAGDITAPTWPPTPATRCRPSAGIVAANRPVPRRWPRRWRPVFTEVVVAPSFDAAALEVLAAKKNLRVLSAPAPPGTGLDVRGIDGGLLVQQADTVSLDRRAWRVVTKAAAGRRALARAGLRLAGRAPR